MMSVFTLGLATFFGGTLANFYFLIFLWDKKVNVREVAVALIRASYTGESVAEALGPSADLPDSIIRQLERLKIERQP